MRLKEKVLMTALIILLSAGNGIGQDTRDDDLCRHEIGVGYILPFGYSSINKVLDFSYKYHFDKGTLRTNLMLSSVKSLTFYDPEYRTSLDQSVAAYLGYELSKEFGAFRLHYGADMGARWGRNGSNWEPEPVDLTADDIDHGWTFGFRPLVGIGYRILPALSVSFEYLLNTGFQLPKGFEYVGEDRYEYEWFMLPQGILSLTYLF